MTPFLACRFAAACGATLTPVVSLCLIAETAMSDPVDALVLDLLDWIGPRARPYAEVIDAWRTSCPRLPVWEEANTRGYIDHQHSPDRGAFVSVSPLGMALLEGRRHREASGSPLHPEAPRAA
jgi:hypothetical protein